MSSTETFLTETDQISAEWLEKILRVTDERVAIRQAEIVQELHPPYSHAACLLRAAYAANPGGLPVTFFFKIGHRPGEADFHQRFAPRTNSPALVTCYHAECANHLGMSNILLDDLSASHAILPDDEHVQKMHLMSMVETLAGIHRQWWQHADLQPGQPGLEDLMGFVWEGTCNKLDSYFNAAGDGLTAEQRRIYVRIFASLPLPAWTERIKQHQAVTLSHGDTNLRNFLWPLDGKPTPKLIDWALWHVNLPTYDLSYLLALRVNSEQRRQTEKEILRNYLQMLSIDGYGWNELANDYRLSIIQQTVWPVFFHDFAPKDSWLALLQKIMGAFTDWNCGELLS